MRKGRRSAERLSYWPELGSRALPAPAGVNDAANKGSVDAAGDECRRGVVCLQGGRHYDWSINPAGRNAFGLKVVVWLAGRPRPSHHQRAGLADFFTPVF
jgi:hypothetical protein